jgi:choline dehydrogenase-like flavoprotein
MRTLFRGGGSAVTFGRSSLVLLQGRCVGGSTTVNSAIAMRPPEDVLDEWRLPGIDARALEPHVTALEQRLSVRTPAPAALGEHNRLFGEAAKRLGIDAAPLRRFDGGCVGSARCLTGCGEGKKLGMGVTLIPDALARGARLYSDVRVNAVELTDGRATGVVAKDLRVHARRGVLVCASAIQTPNLLRRSGLRSPALGRHFQCHPGISLTGRFDRDVRQQHGATQGFNSTHFSHTHRFKLESVSLPPELAAMGIPGAGASLVENLGRYGNLMSWAVALRAEAHGRVTGLLGADQALFTPSPVDMTRLRVGLKVLTQMMFEVGAREVWPSVHGMPQALRSAGEARLWDRASVDPRAYPLVTSHLFGTARMGMDARTSVVGLDFQTHEARGLYVLDSSVFPSNLGVNPQLTVMAMARLAASRLA